MEAPQCIKASLTSPDNKKLHATGSPIVWSAVLINAHHNRIALGTSEEGLCLTQ